MSEHRFILLVMMAIPPITYLCCLFGRTGYLRATQLFTAQQMRKRFRQQRTTE